MFSFGKFIHSLYNSIQCLLGWCGLITQMWRITQCYACFHGSLRPIPESTQPFLQALLPSTKQSSSPLNWKLRISNFNTSPHSPPFSVLRLGALAASHAVHLKVDTSPLCPGSSWGVWEDLQQATSLDLDTYHLLSRGVWLIRKMSKNVKWNPKTNW